jgi:hypothetical protein
MKTRAHYSLLTLLGLALMAVAGPANAVTKTPIAFTIIITDLSPGTEWFTPNTLHVRGQMIAGIVTGDLDGTIEAEVNTHLNVTNPAVGFAGIQIRSAFAITTATVTWVGTVTDAGPLGRGTNLLVAHGTDGSKILGKIFGQPDGTFLVEGTIMEP